MSNLSSSPRCLRLTDTAVSILLQEAVAMSLLFVAFPPSSLSFIQIKSISLKAFRGMTRDKSQFKVSSFSQILKIRETTLATTKEVVAVEAATFINFRGIEILFFGSAILTALFGKSINYSQNLNLGKICQEIASSPCKQIRVLCFLFSSPTTATNP